MFHTSCNMHINTFHFEVYKIIWWWIVDYKKKYTAETNGVNEKITFENNLGVQNNSMNKKIFFVKYEINITLRDPSYSFIIIIF